MRQGSQIKLKGTNQAGGPVKFLTGAKMRRNNVKPIGNRKSGEFRFILLDKFNLGDFEK